MPQANSYHSMITQANKSNTIIIITFQAVIVNINNVGIKGPWCGVNQHSLASTSRDRTKKWATNRAIWELEVTQATWDPEQVVARMPEKSMQETLDQLADHHVSILKSLPKRYFIFILDYF
uniref:Uncharacterized protein n=1 Tax=Angiostrongylus cantonensis TaxID=6313 RepID=A0A0K0D2N3_ANGCA